MSNSNVPLKPAYVSSEAPFPPTPAGRVAAYRKQAMQERDLLKSNLGLLASVGMDVVRWCHSSLASHFEEDQPSLETLRAATPGIAAWQKSSQQMIGMIGLLMKMEK